MALIRRLWRWLRSPWSVDRVFGVSVAILGGLGVIAIVAFMVALVMGMSEGRRREAQIPTEAERRINRYLMPDGTVCYESRYGYGISCLRP
jgi:hypothetical protein